MSKSTKGNAMRMASLAMAAVVASMLNPQLTWGQSSDVSGLWRGTLFSNCSPVQLTVTAVGGAASAGMIIECGAMGASEAWTGVYRLGSSKVDLKLSPTTTTWGGYVLDSTISLREVDQCTLLVRVSDTQGHQATQYFHKLSDVCQ
jgi:hypothetical protein